MSDLLAVLNPRRIDECVRSLDALPVDRLWLRRMSEAQIADRWNEILRQAAGYDRLILVSDDVIVPPHALHAVRRLLDQGHPAVTGWCNLAADDLRANLTRTPLGPQPVVDAYDFYPPGDVFAWPEPAVPTFLINLALTGMSVELWARFPFGCYGRAGRGYASDFHLSKRLARAGVPMVAARDGFVWHVKERWNQADREPRKHPQPGTPAIDLLTI